MFLRAASVAAVVMALLLVASPADAQVYYGGYAPGGYAPGGYSATTGIGGYSATTGIGAYHVWNGTGQNSYQYGGNVGGYQYGGFQSYQSGGPSYYQAQPGFSRGGLNPTTQYHYSMPRVTTGFGFQTLQPYPNYRRGYRYGYRRGW